MGRGKRSFGENFIVLLFSALFLFSLIMLVSQGMRTTGYATTATTSSNVTIATYFAISMSNNLSNGIEFGTISLLPVTSVNATDNNNSANSTGGGGTYDQGTSMWINVSTDSNSAVDFCILADALNTSTGDEIGLDNETWGNYTATNISYPRVSTETGLTTSYVASGYNIAVGGSNYYRFWLDVPAATPTGTYNNTVSFKGVATGGAC